MSRNSTSAASLRCCIAPLSPPTSGCRFLGQTSPRPVHGLGAGVAVDPEQLAGFGGRSHRTSLSQPTRRWCTFGAQHGTLGERRHPAAPSVVGMARPRDRRADWWRHARPAHPVRAQTEGAAQAIQGNVRNQYEKDGRARPGGRARRPHRGRDRGRRGGRREHHRCQRALPHPDRRAGHLRRPPRPGHAARRAERRRGQGLLHCRSSPRTTPRRERSSSARTCAPPRASGRNCPRCSPTGSSWRRSSPSRRSGCR